MYIGQIGQLIPILYLCAAAIIVLIVGVCAAKKPDKGLDHWAPAQYLAQGGAFFAVVLSGWLVSLSLRSASATSLAIIGQEQIRVPFSNLFVTAGGHAQLVMDPFAAIFGFIACAGLLVVTLLSLDHFGEHQIHKGEYYALLMFATAAAALCAAASDLIAIYLSIEFLSLASYVLAAYAKRDRRSAEAGLKYFLYGAACSAVMVYGMSILFGITGGSTALSAVAQALSPDAAGSGAAWVGVMFVLVGLGFKVSLVPFHFWTPDVYEGAPTPVTAYLSVVSKAAGLAVLARFLMVVGLPTAGFSLSWYWILVALTAASMFYGNLVAIPQRNIKRMLGYSSIAQIGYFLIGFLAAVAAARSGIADDWGMQGVVIYFLAYLFTNLGAFAVVVAAEKGLGSERIDDYAGLMKRSPVLASAMTVFLVSLAGVPPTAGFLGKFFIFGGAIKIGLADHPELVVLAILGVINSVISAFYYLNIVRLMFFAPAAEESAFKPSRGLVGALTICLVVTLGLIIFAKPVSDLAGQVAYAVAAGRGIILH
jgi:NADH-quinone oxidoreductase subunit N